TTFASGEGFADLSGTAAFDTRAPASGHQAVGSYPIDVSGLTSTNYAITFASGANRGTLTITARPITIKANDVSRVYGDSTPAFVLALTGGTTFASGEGFADLSGTAAFDTGAPASGHQAVGSYPIDV